MIMAFSISDLSRAIMTNITRILNAIEQGDARAIDQLLPAVYQELRQLAAWKLSHELPGQTLQATALVHEAYIRLVGNEAQDWKSRGHFFAAAAEAMRHILIENARRKQALKRGGDYRRVDMEDGELAIEEPPEDLIALDEALAKLEGEDRAVADVVKLRYFGGLSLEQAAEILGISRRTADRYWAYARARLYQEITKGNQPPPR
jgi:RNA polymerase sigma factor (TIGR02999 family)